MRVIRHALDVKERRHKCFIHVSIASLSDAAASKGQLSANRAPPCDCGHGRSRACSAASPLAVGCGVCSAGVRLDIAQPGLQLFTSLPSLVGFWAARYCFTSRASCGDGVLQLVSTDGEDRAAWADVPTRATVGYMYVYLLKLTKSGRVLRLGVVPT